MAKKPKRQITDEEILSMQDVPTMLAADYLGMTYPMLTWKLQQGELPFGTAIKNKTWAYHINPKALVNYKNGKEDASILQVIHKQLEENQKQLSKILELLQQYMELNK